MLIGELAHQCGISTRALRHYEEAGLLVPDRDTNGYRIYDHTAIETVARIRLLLDAGLNATAITTYLDCLSKGDHGFQLRMCPSLRAKLAAVDAEFAARQATLASRREALSGLASLAR